MAARHNIQDLFIVNSRFSYFSQCNGLLEPPFWTKEGDQYLSFVTGMDLTDFRLEFLILPDPALSSQHL